MNGCRIRSQLDPRHELVRELTVTTITLLLGVLAAGMLVVGVVLVVARATSGQHCSRTSRTSQEKPAVTSDGGIATLAIGDVGTSGSDRDDSNGGDSDGSDGGGGDGGGGGD